MKSLMRLAIFGLGSLFLLLLLPQQVFACSGYPQPYILEEMLERDIFVKGRIIEVDSIGQSSILQVEQYFKGDGPEFLLLSHGNNTLYATHHYRNYDTGCLYDGVGGKYSIGEDGYYALNRRNNGSWSDGSGVYSPAAHYSTHEGMVANILEDPENDGERLIHPIPVEEFEALVLEQTASEPTLPNFDANMPLLTPLIITTESGQEYLFPVDYAPLFELDAPDCEFRCPVWAPDDTHAATWISETELKFTYPYSQEDQYSEYDPERGVLLGEAVWFSPNSNYAIVLDGDVLRLYLLDNKETGGMYGAFITPIELTEISVSLSDDLPLVIDWSGNSSVLVYQDTEGIWTLDFNRKSEPEMLISTEDLQYEFAGGGDLLGVSTTGRYVRFGSAVWGWYLRDTFTGEQFFNGITSPDEGRIARFGHTRRKIREGCELPLNTNCSFGVDPETEFELIDWGWVDNFNAFAFYCSREDRQRCRVQTHNFLLDNIVDRQFGYEPIVAVDHDSGFDYFAAALEDGQITIAATVEDYVTRYGSKMEFDFSDQLDAPVVQIVWGNSIFFTYP